MMRHAWDLPAPRARALGRGHPGSDHRAAPVDAQVLAGDHGGVLAREVATREAIPSGVTKRPAGISSRAGSPLSPTQISRASPVSAMVGDTAVIVMAGCCAVAMARSRLGGWRPERRSPQA